MAKFALDVFSHHFAVTGFNERGGRELESYSAIFAEWQYVKRWNGGKRELIRKFIGVTADGSEYRFHINAYEEFLVAMARYGYNKNDFNITVHPLYQPVNVDLPMKPLFVERPKQIPLIKHFVSDGVTKLGELQAGGGKTAGTLKALSLIGQRFALVVKAGLINTWLDSMIVPSKQYMMLTKDDIVVVRGGRDLQDLIEIALRGELDVKAIVISNATLRNMYAQYEAYDHRQCDLYGIHPVLLWQTLGVGVVINDEGHLEFHANFRQDLYSHVPKHIILTATLFTKNPFLRKMYECMFPKASRTDPGEYDRYVYVRAMHYNLSGYTQIRTTERGSNTYSHNAFEESIMKNPKALVRYNELIGDIVQRDFVDIQKPGERCLILATRVDFCEQLTNYLANKYPTLNVNKYTTGDPDEALMESDIAISTIGSSGTGKDVKKLIRVILTVAVNEGKTNEQIKSRMRKPDNYPETIPEFIYLVCDDIEKHCGYHEEKIPLFRGRCLSHTNVILQHRL